MDGFYYTVVQGDCLSKIAYRNKLPSWQTIYDHPNNREFRQLRTNPNVIYPGDRVFVPHIQRRDESGSTEKRHRFNVRGDPVYVRLWVQDDQDRPLKGAKYVLEIENKPPIEGEIGADGKIEMKIKATDDHGVLRVFPPPGKPDSVVRWPLQLGHLDPIETMSGIQARLNNLGFNSGAVDGICGPITEGAVRRFQEQYGLVVDGIPGPKTQTKLKEVHRV